MFSASHILASRHVTAASLGISRTWRRLLGVVLTLHGLAHASVSTWAGTYEAFWLINTLWSAALLGYLIAGFGFLGVPLARRVWPHALAIGMGTSIALLTIVGGPYRWLGLMLDAGVLILLIRWASEPVPDLQPVGVVTRRRRVANAFSIAAIMYVTAVVLFRPVYVSWGTTPDERTMPMPGDQLAPEARYRVDHAITIRAPTDSVWPWLVQIGQDRGGFYSYDWLERFFGDNVHNANRIHAEWQTLRAGDRIRAAQPDYVWGLGDFSWKVLEVQPGRALVLENWGAFVLAPVNDSTTRFLIRARGDGRPSMAGLLLGSVSVFVFEPAHFIMQRAMMYGIRDRAERMARTGEGFYQMR